MNTKFLGPIVGLIGLAVTGALLTFGLSATASGSGDIVYEAPDWDIEHNSNPHDDIDYYEEIRGGLACFDEGTGGNKQSCEDISGTVDAVKDSDGMAWEDSGGDAYVTCTIDKVISPIDTGTETHYRYAMSVKFHADTTDWPSTPWPKIKCEWTVSGGSHDGDKVIYKTDWDDWASL